MCFPERPDWSDCLDNLAFLEILDNLDKLEILAFLDILLRNYNDINYQKQYLCSYTNIGV